MQTYGLQRKILVGGVTQAYFMLLSAIKRVELIDKMVYAVTNLYGPKSKCH